MKNIFHELGHSLHSILSFHEFQQISNVFPIDYAEMVASIFENYFF
jgi:Zn-dependent oligopeptidase